MACWLTCQSPGILEMDVVDIGVAGTVWQWQKLLKPTDDVVVVVQCG